MIRRRSGQAGDAVNPHKFRHGFSRRWLDTGAEGDLNGWSSPQMLGHSSRARRAYDRVMEASHPGPAPCRTPRRSPRDGRRLLLGRAAPSAGCRAWSGSWPTGRTRARSSGAPPGRRTGTRGMSRSGSIRDRVTEHTSTEDAVPAVLRSAWARRLGARSGSPSAGPTAPSALPALRR